MRIPKELCIPRFSQWLSAALTDWAIIVLAMVGARGLAVRAHLPVAILLYWAAVLIVGNRQHALALLGHEGSHHLATRVRWLNDLATNIFFFWPMGFALNSYRRMHSDHHRKLGTKDDPEYVYKAHSAPFYDLPIAGPAHVVKNFFLTLILLGGGVREQLKFFLDMQPKRIGEWIGMLGFRLAALAVIAWAGAWWILGVWFMALLTSFWAVFRLREWTEHVGTGETQRTSATWWQRALFLPHNTYHHFEHHRHPQVPCWNLPKVRVLESSTPVVSVNELIQAFSCSQDILTCQPLRSQPELWVPRVQKHEREGVAS